MVRDYTPDVAASFLKILRQGKLVCRDEQVRDLLAVMIDTAEETEDEFRTRTDALDPALPCLFWQAGYWSSELKERFEVLHDDSKSVQRWQQDIFSGMQAHLADRTASETFELGEVTVHLPTLLNNVRFGASHDDARLQVADVLAGSAAYLYAVATGARRDDSDFAKRLHRAGIPELMKEAVGPSA
jgi:hypothetical protein